MIVTQEFLDTYINELVNYGLSMQYVAGLEERFGYRVADLVGVEPWQVRQARNLGHSGLYQLQMALAAKLAETRRLKSTNGAANANQPPSPQTYLQADGYYWQRPKGYYNQEPE